jgi:hypothetical protein
MPIWLRCSAVLISFSETEWAPAYDSFPCVALSGHQSGADPVADPVVAYTGQFASHLDCRLR